MEVVNIISEAAKIYGFPFALFIGLVFYTLHQHKEMIKKYDERELRYIKVIETLSDDVKERLTLIEAELKVRWSHEKN